MDDPSARPQPLAIGDIFLQRSRSAERETAARREQMLEQVRASIENSQDPNAYIAAARRCKQLGRLDEALDILQRGVGRCAPTAALHEYYVERLEKCNRTEEAIAAAREATVLFPDRLIFKLREALLLPIFYTSSGQVEHYRRRFTEGLHRVIAETRLDTAGERQRALAAISTNGNNYLPYQGQDDRYLQTLYASWVQRIMAANYPQWTQPVVKPPVTDKIRVGFLSASRARFSVLSAAKLFGAWIRDLDRNQFDIFAYHGDGGAGEKEGQDNRWNVSFREFSGEVERIAPAILADQLHILIHLDYGIHPRMEQLGALRLAPVQCVTWNTPVTSGMPNIDYFLTGELMEPADGQSHYSERMVALPGVGVCFGKPVIPTLILKKRREDFGLRNDAIVYLCCQSVFKYLPEQDSLIVQIAKRAPNSQFVFLSTNEVVARDFRNRLENAFAAEGLRAADYCVWLPEMPLLEFWNLYLVGDVCLDTLGWSGGVTTFEAIACRLPVVTLPGKLMRSRHSYAILTQLGVTETIARAAEEYVEIAVRLGKDREWRQMVIDRMAAGYSRLYSDTRSTKALEAFCLRA